MFNLDKLEKLNIPYKEMIKTETISQDKFVICFHETSVPSYQFIMYKSELRGKNWKHSVTMNNYLKINNDFMLDISNNSFKDFFKIYQIALLKIKERLKMFNVVRIMNVYSFEEFKEVSSGNYVFSIRMKGMRKEFVFEVIFNLLDNKILFRNKKTSMHATTELLLSDDFDNKFDDFIYQFIRDLYKVEMDKLESLYGYKIEDFKDNIEEYISILEMESI